MYNYNYQYIQIAARSIQESLAWNHVYTPPFFLEKKYSAVVLPRLSLPLQRDRLTKRSVLSCVAGVPKRRVTRRLHGRCTTENIAIQVRIMLKSCYICGRLCRVWQHNALALE